MFEKSTKFIEGGVAEDEVELPAAFVEEF